MATTGSPSSQRGAFSRVVQGGLEAPMMPLGDPWVGTPARTPPGMPASFEATQQPWPQHHNMSVGSSPGPDGELGATAPQRTMQTEIDAMKIAMGTMLAKLQALIDQQQQSQQQPQPQHQPQQQQPPQQPQPTQQPPKLDPWHQAINSGSGGFPAGPGGGGSGGFPGGSGDNGNFGISCGWADIHYKDVTPPAKYKGDVNQWRYWYTKFSTFLTRRNIKWDGFLSAIRDDSKVPYEIGGDKEKAIFAKIEVTSQEVMQKIKCQLYEYLENFSDGLTHSMIVAAGPRGSMEVFRQMCDEGFSSRDRNLRKEYRKIMQPKQATFEGLRKAILDWETELSQYELAAGQGCAMGERDRVMCLEDMCPDPLQQYLESKEKLVTYADYKLAIHDYLVNRARWAGRSRINWIGAQEDFGASYAEEAEKLEDPEEPSGEAIAAFLEHFPQLNAISGEINALVKNKFGKSNKGNGKKGKSTGKGSGDNGGDGGKDAKDDKKGKGKGRRCFECDSEEHIARDCPVRKDRVAKGGPERMPKGNGKGYPTQAQWNKWIPGPSAGTWKSYWPGVQGKGAFQGTPMQLSPFMAPQEHNPGQSVLQSLFGGLIPLSCVNAKSCKSVTTNAKLVTMRRIRTKFAKEVETKNSFAALASEDPGNSDEGPETPKRAEVEVVDKFSIPRQRQRKVRFMSSIGCTTNCGGKCDEATYCNPDKNVTDGVDLVNNNAELETNSFTHNVNNLKEVNNLEKIKHVDALDFVNFKLDKFDTTETILNTTISDLAKSKFKSRRVQTGVSPSLSPKSDDEIKHAKNSISMLNQITKNKNLMPVVQKEELKTRLGKFEILSSIVDSGATVPVMNPKTGASYNIIPSSANGTEYELADGETLEDLGAKNMAVLTIEGTLRGYATRCADVTKSLQAVRALVKSDHAVCFGLGDGSDHLIINKITGEVNRMRDDGINYLQDLIIVPPDQVDNVARELAAIQQFHSNTNDGGEDESSFGRHGR